jgi:hypothetical protein
MHCPATDPAAAVQSAAVSGSGAVSSSEWQRCSQPTAAAMQPTAVEVQPTAAADFCPRLTHLHGCHNMTPAQVIKVQ